MGARIFLSEKIQTPEHIWGFSCFHIHLQRVIQNPTNPTFFDREEFFSPLYRSLDRETSEKRFHTFK